MEKETPEQFFRMKMRSLFNTSIKASKKKEKKVNSSSIWGGIDVLDDKNEKITNIEPEKKV